MPHTHDGTAHLLLPHVKLLAHHGQHEFLPVPGCQSLGLEAQHPLAALIVLRIFPGRLDALPKQVVVRRRLKVIGPHNVVVYLPEPLYGAKRLDGFGQFIVVHFRLARGCPVAPKGVPVLCLRPCIRSTPIGLAATCGSLVHSCWAAIFPLSFLDLRLSGQINPWRTLYQAFWFTELHL